MLSETLTMQKSSHTCVIRDISYADILTYVFHLKHYTYSNGKSSVSFNIKLTWAVELLVGFQDVAFLPSLAELSTTSMKFFFRGRVLRTTTCPKTLVGVSKGMLPVRYHHSNKASFLCQSNFMEIARLLQR